MADFKETMTYLRRMKFLLNRGDQKQIADRLGVRSNKISLALSGGVKDLKFLNRLVAECREQIETAEAAFK